MKTKLLSIWEERILNKYTLYAMVFLFALLILYIKRDNVLMLLRWLFIDTIGTLITNSINDANFRQQFWNFIFGSSVTSIIALVCKKNNDKNK